MKGYKSKGITRKFNKDNNVIVKCNMDSNAQRAIVFPHKKLSAKILHTV